MPRKNGINSDDDDDIE